MSKPASKPAGCRRRLGLPAHRSLSHSTSGSIDPPVLPRARLSIPRDRERRSRTRLAQSAVVESVLPTRSHSETLGQTVAPSHSERVAPRMAMARRDKKHRGSSDSQYSLKLQSVQASLRRTPTLIFAIHYQPWIVFQKIHRRSHEGVLRQV